LTTEDDFQRAIDADPGDWHTRLVFADWLDERGDARGPGYRAIALQQRRPLSGMHFGLKREGFWWHVAPRSGVPVSDNDIPRDWFSLLPPGDGDQAFWPRHTPRGGLRTRRQVEDALARAFAKLPPERQAELLSPPIPMAKPGRKKPAKKKPAAKPVAKKPAGAKKPGRPKPKG
jgi:uncharacterized protein (TIGR02996 family)